jgi:hypothetical protein
VSGGIAPRGNRVGRGDGELRRTTLAGECVEYRLVRVRRRTIGMQIDLAGLTVRASRWVPIREIEAALAERAQWILRGLAEWSRRRRDVLPREWKDGAPILYRGQDLTLAVHPARAPSIRADLFHLRVGHPVPDDPHAIAASVGRWLKDEALATIVPRVALYADRVRATLPPLRLSNARSEWGSCNHRGEIRLNWRLVLLPPNLADYVIAHEIAHLVELNHSARFWAIVESLFPNHARARRALGEWTALLEA